MNPTPPDRAMPVILYTEVKPADTGLYVLAALDCTTLGLVNARLVLDMNNDKLALFAECGCAVHLSISGLLQRLAAMASAEAHGAPISTATH